MEQTPPYPRRLNVNLKNLPPINPRTGNGNHFSIPAKFEKSRYIRRVPQSTPPNHRPEMKPNGDDGSGMKPVSSDTARALNTKTIPEASSGFLVTKKENTREIASTCSCGHRSAKEGTSKKRAAKSLLFEICAANNWNPPLFECCEEEGPSHGRKFRFKVVVKMKGGGGAVLECYGNPQTRKKVAAEHAAEGALWCLKNLGYSPKT